MVIWYQFGGPHNLVPFGGTTNNPNILKALEPLFKSLHDGHLHLVAVLRYSPPKVLEMSLFYAKLDNSLISGPCISLTNHHIAVISLGLNEYVT